MQSGETRSLLEHAEARGKVDDETLDLLEDSMEAELLAQRTAVRTMQRAARHRAARAHCATQLQAAARRMRGRISFVQLQSAARTTQRCWRGYALRLALVTKTSLKRNQLQMRTLARHLFRTRRAAEERENALVAPE